MSTKINGEIGVFWINTICTLKCRNCITLTPYHKNALNYPLENIKSDMNCFYNIYNWVDHLDIEGGESLLHPELLEIVEYAFENYGKNFKRLHILTNGTLLPKKELLKYCANKDVFFIIDDYGALSSKKNELVELLIEHNIDFRIDVYHGDMQYYGGWIDFGNMEYKNYSSEQLGEVFLNCRQGSIKAPYVKDGKIFQCSIQGAGISHIPLVPRQYVDFRSGMPLEEQIEIATQFCKKPVNSCKYCNGFDTKGERISAAVQLDEITLSMKFAGSV